MTSIINLQPCGGSLKIDDTNIPTNLARIQLDCCGDGDCDHSGICEKCDHQDGGCVHPDGKGACERPSFSTEAKAMTACLQKCKGGKCNIISLNEKFYFKCTKIS